MSLADAIRSVLGRSRTSPAPGNRAGPRRPVTAGSPAPPVQGVAPDGSAVAADTQSGRLNLVFLTSECRECEAAWGQVVARPARMVVVTPGPETESARRVARLSMVDTSAPAVTEPPAGVTVVMSSDAWHAYGVNKAPWVVEIDSGFVVGSAPATY